MPHALQAREFCWNGLATGDAEANDWHGKVFGWQCDEHDRGD